MQKSPRVAQSFAFEISGLRFVTQLTELSLVGVQIENISSLTVIEIDLNQHMATAWLEDTLDFYLREDDMIKPEFFSNVLLIGSEELEWNDIETNLGMSRVQSTQVSDTIRGVFLGSYITCNGSLYQALELYDDVQNTFAIPLHCLPQSTFFSFTPPRLGNQRRNCASTAVKTCLLPHTHTSRDLHKYHVVVKDAFDLAGVKTSLCSKAYLELYPPETSNAVAIADLIERCVQVLGTTKLVSFLSREEPSETVDFKTPWNPRGDGYQGPGGSSSGSVTAVVAYDWVDVGIGTDSQ